MPENLFEFSVAAGVALMLIREFIMYANGQKKERDMQALELRLNKIEEATGKISLSLEKLTILLDILIKERTK